ncbi:hypothetical protein ACJ41O_007678 [Fusarium nematophilum]
MDHYDHYGSDSTSECAHCEWWSPSPTDALSHERDVHLYCSECDRSFQNANNIKQHMNSSQHRTSQLACPFCKATCGSATGMAHPLEREACPKSPLGRDKLYQDIRERDPNDVISNEHPGWDGEKTFEVDPKEAWNARLEVYECYLCHQLFGLLGSLRQHLKSPTHQQNLYHWHEPPEFECAVCDWYFDNEEDRQDHEIGDHLYCSECDWFFSRWDDIQQHLRRSRHRQPSVVCPFCSALYGTATGLTHHLERGCCPSAPLDRDELYREIRRRDPNGCISNNNLLEWHGASTTYEATQRAWNPRHGQYECYLCHSLFRSLHGLNQHLSSPQHQQNLYRCPNRSCIGEFTTLAGLINHLESESCSSSRFDACIVAFEGLSL